MKKWFAMILLLIVMFIWNQTSEISDPVFSESTFHSNKFELVKIDVSNASITTKNITSLLENMSLLKVEYEIPKLYQSKFRKSYFEYTLEDKSINRGLQKIEKTVSNQFLQMGYPKEVERIFFYGIKIRSIEVYGRSYEIEAFEQKIKKN